MVATRKRYGVALGTDTIAAFSGRANIYDSLKTELGLVDAEGEAAQSKTIIRTAVSKIPALSRIAVTYQRTATAVATGRIICATSKLEEALSTLPSKTYNSKSIIRAYIPRRQFFV